MWLISGLIFVAILAVIECEDAGFELLFQSNVDIYTDSPIKFNEPLPSWLKGILIRNGPALFEMGNRSFTHVFDGYGKLMSIKFPGNESTVFSTRFIQSKFYKESLKLGDIAPFLLFDSTVPPITGIINKLEAILINGLDNPNVNILANFSNQREFFAWSDLPFFYRIESWRLKTSERCDIVPLFSLSLYIPVLSTAHPVKEFQRDTYISFVSYIHLEPIFTKHKIEVIRIYPSGDHDLIATLHMANLPYMHSFALSKHYAILFAHPFYVSVASLIFGKSPLDSVIWHDDQSLTIYVVRLRDGNIKELTIKPQFIMHFVNAFETDDHIFCDVVTYHDASLVKNMKVDIVLDPKKRDSKVINAALFRVDFDISAWTVNAIKFNTTRGKEAVAKLDLPTINEEFRFQPYCFVYGMTYQTNSSRMADMALIKRDLCQSGKDLIWSRENHYPSEAWFIPAPGPKGALQEDSGLLVSIILDGNDRKSYVAIFNATNFQIINLAVLPTAIPMSFHGRFFPDDWHNSAKPREPREMEEMY